MKPLRGRTYFWDLNKWCWMSCCKEKKWAEILGVWCFPDFLIILDWKSQKSREFDIPGHDPDPHPPPLKRNVLFLVAKRLSNERGMLRQQQYWLLKHKHARKTMELRLLLILRIFNARSLSQDSGSWKDVVFAFIFYWFPRSLSSSMLVCVVWIHVASLHASLVLPQKNSFLDQLLALALCTSDTEIRGKLMIIIT